MVFWIKPLIKILGNVIHLSIEYILIKLIGNCALKKEETANTNVRLAASTCLLQLAFFKNPI